MLLEARRRPRRGGRARAGNTGVSPDRAAAARCGLDAVAGPTALASTQPTTPSCRSLSPWRTRCPCGPDFAAMERRRLHGPLSPSTRWWRCSNINSVRRQQAEVGMPASAGCRRLGASRHPPRRRPGPIFAEDRHWRSLRISIPRSYHGSARRSFWSGPHARRRGCRHSRAHVLRRRPGAAEPLHADDAAGEDARRDLRPAHGGSATAARRRT